MNHLFTDQLVVNRRLSFEQNLPCPWGYQSKYRMAPLIFRGCRSQDQIRDFTCLNHHRQLQCWKPGQDSALELKVALCSSCFGACHLRDGDHGTQCSEHMGTSTCYPRALKIWTDNGDMGVGRKQGGHLPQKSQQELEQHPAKGTHIHSTLNHLIHELEKFSNKSTVNILNTKNLFSKA